jgi:hypothetical protein
VSDTPRTDAVLATCEEYAYAALVSFARQLERELNELKKNLANPLDNPLAMP